MTIALLDRPAPIDHEATRWQFLIGGASLAALLASCSTSTPTPASPPARTGFPVTITHKYGRTEITKAPERVVVVGLTEQDALLALGLTPVATREWFGEQPGALWSWARTAAGGAPLPEVLTYELNYEKIAALRPDLILGLVWGVTAGGRGRTTRCRGSTPGEAEADRARLVDIPVDQAGPGLVKRSLDNRVR